MSNSYERYKYFSGASDDLQFIDSNSVTKFFDEQGNFHCYWEAPNLLKTQWNSDSMTRAFVFAYSGDNVVAHLRTTTPLNTGKAFFPSDLMSALVAEGDRLEVRFENRSSDAFNRAISSHELITLGQPVIPDEWEKPFDDDWATYGIDSLKWNTTYIAWPTSIEIGANSIDMNTFDTEPGGGVAFFSSKYYLSGDFDIQVDYEIIDWQPGSCGRLDFQYGYGPYSRNHILIGIKQDPNTSNRYYTSEACEMDPNPENLDGSYHFSDQIPTNDITGKLRITREGNIFRTFYWQGPTWTQLGQWEYGNPLIFEIGSQPVSMLLNNNAFGFGCGENASANINVQFSNFKINSN